jgi:hypothetical protein
MKAGAGKIKGIIWERKICAQLSLWVTNGKQNDVFWRSAVSGGRATVRLQKGIRSKHISGDICAVHEAGNLLMKYLFIEAKSYRILNLDRLIKGTGNLSNFWTIAKQQAKDNFKYPFLIAKQNMLEPLVCINWKTVKMLDISDMLLMSVYKSDLHILLWSDFLDLEAREVLNHFRSSLHITPRRRLSLPAHPVAGRTSVAASD